MNDHHGNERGELYSGKAVALYLRHDCIVTNRLDDHVLSCLMDENITRIDSGYGKNSTYINE